MPNRIDRNANSLGRLRRNAQRTATQESTAGIILSSTGGLQFTATGLAIELQSSSALRLNSTGLAVAPDGATIIINGMNQLQSLTSGSGGGTVSSAALVMPSTIFSVAGSPITGIGTFTVTYKTEPSTTIFAGPSSGANATPTFRALTAGDIPSLSYVTSVGMAMPSTFTVTNSPVTTAGTLTAAWNTQLSTTSFMGPSSGAAATPTFRRLVSTDLPALQYSAPPDNVTISTNATPNIYALVSSSGGIASALPGGPPGLYTYGPILQTSDPVPGLGGGPGSIAANAGVQWFNTTTGATKILGAVDANSNFTGGTIAFLTTSFAINQVLTASTTPLQFTNYTYLFPSTYLNNFGRIFRVRALATVGISVLNTLVWHARLNGVDVNTYSTGVGVTGTGSILWEFDVLTNITGSTGITRAIGFAFTENQTLTPQAAAFSNTTHDLTSTALFDFAVSAATTTASDTMTMKFMEVIVLA